MSTIFNNHDNREQFSQIFNYNDISKETDIDQFHQNIIKVTTLRQQSQENFEQSWLPYRKTIKFISQLTHIPSYILNNYARTIFFLFLLGIMFPLNLLITLFTLILSYFTNLIPHKQIKPMSNSNSKRILISGGRMTKALHLCRSFHKAGHQIILVDESINWLTGHRWSNSVERFYVYPSPNEESNAYINTLANIVRKEKINIFIPVIPTYNSQIDAQLKSALAAYNCSIFHIDSDDTTIIDNKYTFINKVQSLGLTTPKSYLITSRHQLLNFDFNNNDCSYICKNASFNHANHQSTIKLPRSTHAETVEYINRLPIKENYPYILQEFISGKEYLTHVTCMNGEITLFTCSYSSLSKFNYKHIEQPAISKWCTEYIRTSKLTGHFSFHFIVSEHDGKAYAINCNSYVNSAITSFYSHPNIADAYLSNECLSMRMPLSSARLIYWLPHELWHLFRNIRSTKDALKSLKTIFYGKEAIWSWNDPLPFLLHYHIHILYLLLNNLFSKHIRFFNEIDCSIGGFS
ncbi:unnamed protein product [Adineta steineri]|uniref:ATP-grasp domain-containing protein n=1 Tax=Adineta steineri TaxID=433720 RepID=A0A818PV87_9BILA|nr:unnamed protein product [Adineta steineri]